MDIEEDSHYDVLISGGGPAGLFAAINFVKLGHSVLILEKALDISPLTRATIIQVRTLEIFSQLGILDRYLAKARAIHGATVYGTGGKRLMDTDMRVVDSPFNYCLSLRQPINEQLMIDIVETYGVHVRRGWEFCEMAYDDKTGISKVTVKNIDNPEKVRSVNAYYVVGADGSHSRVRKSAGINYPGSPFQAVAVNSDVLAETDFPTNETFSSSFWTPNGGAFLTKMDDKYWRISMECIPGVTHDRLLPFEDCEAIIKKIVAPYTFKISHIESFLNYKISVRLADTFVKDNVLITGDAAHIQSPTAGQGLNCALQDSYNMSWKVSLILKGIGRPGELLKSYDTERRQTASYIAKLSTTMYNIVYSTSAFVTFARELLFPTLNSFKWFREFNTASLGGLLISYPASPLTWKNPEPWTLLPSIIAQPGMRCPDAEFFEHATRESTSLHGITPSSGQFSVFFYLPKRLSSGVSNDHANAFTLINSYVASPRSFANRFNVEGFNPIRSSMIAEFEYCKSALPVYQDLKWQFRDKLRLSHDAISVVILRPDGHIGFLRPLTSVPCEEVEAYFDGFLVQQEVREIKPGSSGHGPLPAC